MICVAVKIAEGSSYLSRDVTSRQRDHGCGQNKMSTGECKFKHPRPPYSSRNVRFSEMVNDSLVNMRRNIALF